MAKESTIKLAGQQQQQAGGAGAPPPPVVKGLAERGRAPSFYTVPSLANLSGACVGERGWADRVGFCPLIAPMMGGERRLGFDKGAIHP